MYDFHINPNTDSGTFVVDGETFYWENGTLGHNHQKVNRLPIFLLAHYAPVRPVNWGIVNKLCPRKIDTSTPRYQTADTTVPIILHEAHELSRHPRSHHVHKTHTLVDGMYRAAKIVKSGRRDSTQIKAITCRLIPRLPTKKDELLAESIMLLVSSERYYNEAGLTYVRSALKTFKQ